MSPHSNNNAPLARVFVIARRSGRSTLNGLTHHLKSWQIFPSPAGKFILYRQPFRTMIQRDYLIVGAGIGGASACEGIRKYDKRGSVTLVGAEAYPPYKRWLLSKSFLREKNVVAKKYGEVDERWYAAHKIDVRFNTAVTQLNIDRRVAVLGNGESIEFNKACLAMGSRPSRPSVAGVSLGNVIYLRTIRDALALREMANLEKTVMVIGGGL